MGDLRTLCYLFFLNIVLRNPILTGATCTLPTHLIGQWIDVKKNNVIVNFTSTQLTGWTATVFGEIHSSHTCISSIANVYVFRGDKLYDNFGTSLPYYFCMKLTQASENLFYYYLLADKNSIANNERIYTPAVNNLPDDSSTPTCNYCTFTTAPPDNDYRELRHIGTTETINTSPSLCLPCASTCSSITSTVPAETVIITSTLPTVTYQTTSKQLDTTTSTTTGVQKTTRTAQTTTSTLSRGVACTLPPSLIDQWIDVKKNNITVNFTSTQLTGLTITVAGEIHSSHTCISNIANVYVFRGDKTYHNVGTSLPYYFCMKLTQVSNNLFYYYLLSDKNSIANNERIYTPPADKLPDDSSTPACDYCTFTTPPLDIDYREIRHIGSNETLISSPSLCLPCSSTCEATTTTLLSPAQTVTTQTNSEKPTTTKANIISSDIQSTTQYTSYLNTTDSSTQEHTSQTKLPPTSTSIIPTTAGVSTALSSTQYFQTTSEERTETSTTAAVTSRTDTTPTIIEHLTTSTKTATSQQYTTDQLTQATTHVHLGDGSCTLPPNVIGQWLDFKKNNITVNFTTTQLTGWTVTVTGEIHSSHTCISNTANVYVFRGDKLYDNLGTSLPYYLCMKLTQVSENLLYYYLLSDQNNIANNERIYTPTVNNLPDECSTPTCNYCTFTTQPPDGDYRVLQKLGSNETFTSSPTLCLPCSSTCEATTSTPNISTVETIQTTSEKPKTTEANHISSDVTTAMQITTSHLNTTYKLTQDQTSQTSLLSTSKSSRLTTGGVTTAVSTTQYSSTTPHVITTETLTTAKDTHSTIISTSAERFTTTTATKSSTITSTTLDKHQSTTNVPSESQKTSFTITSTTLDTHQSTTNVPSESQETSSQSPTLSSTSQKTSSQSSISSSTSQKTTTTLQQGNQSPLGSQNGVTDLTTNTILLITSGCISGVLLGLTIISGLCLMRKSFRKVKKPQQRHRRHREIDYNYPFA